MGLYSHLFGDPDVEEQFSDVARLRAMLEVEIALAEAHVEAGLVAPSAIAAIRTAGQVDRYDVAALAQDAARAGNIAIPLIARLTEETSAIDPVAARFVHFGATSQDVIDTGLVLVLRAALPALSSQIDRAACAAARHAHRYRGTPQAGRTWLQQATPITFGLKAAGWLDAIERDRRRLEGAASDAFVLQFGGATGTLAALGSTADAVARALAARLALPMPPMPWHAHRDRFASFACALGILTGTLGKIARDLALLAQTEVAEAFEAPREGHGISSTMPHKQNPVAAAVALAAAARAPGLVASILGGMPQEHERGLGGWHAEWDVLPELFRVTAGAARSVADALEGLVVDTSQMRANLEMTGGLVQAEAIVAALTPHVGRSRAHALVEAASRRAVAERRPLAHILAEDPDVSGTLDGAVIRRLLTPGEYLGHAEAMVTRVLTAWGRERPDGG